MTTTLDENAPLDATQDITLDATQDGAASAHLAWHAEREAALTTEHGWLSLVALHWLPVEPTALPSLPGRWSVADDGAAVVHARASDAITSGGAPVDGEVRVLVEEGRSSSELAFTAHDGTAVVVEVIRRTARTAVRVRDPRAAALTAFTGVPIAAFDPQWVLDVPVTWYDEPRPAVAGAAQHGLVHHVRAVGEVVLERAGRSATLQLTEAGDGTVALLFSDESPDVAPWRVLQAPGRPDDTNLRLDLNRSVNLPYAFSDFGTCPAPLAGNHVPFAVTVGERRPERAA